tara:strand:- start:686 stop:952 length:267 start_codon:yes stop_codon:yes gene_type:complete
MSTIRRGPGYHWADDASGPHGPRTISGFTVDHLDSKTLDQSESEYEKVFILVRDALEEWKELSMENWPHRLQIAQVVSDTLRKKGIVK